MIPIRDTQQSSCIPVVTYGLIAVNLVVFLLQLAAGLDNDALFYTYGLVPAKYTIPGMSMYFSPVNKVFSLFSYMFLHGGFLHFILNMWSLYIFGDNVEDHMGSVRFLLFYILCGLVAGGMHFLLNLASPVPTIGASGAVAGVMGAYFLLYPGSRILTVIPIIIIPWFVEIPAFIFLGVWFAIQFLNAAGSDVGTGIAWWAHVGGFIAGLVLLKTSDLIPHTGARQCLKNYTTRKKTSTLQTISTRAFQNDLDLIGSLTVTSLEAISGTRKLVNLPRGFYNQLYRVNVPPGVRKGTKLKLAGMGKAAVDGSRGDLYLEVIIQNAI